MPLYGPTSLDDLTYDDDNDYQSWRWEGQLHSFEDHPATISKLGREKQWFKHGLMHREESLGPAWIRHNPNYKLYYNLGKLHRRHGPAWIGDESEKWYHYGKIHRVDGPAIIYHNGGVEWWWEDAKYSFDTWEVMSGCDPELSLLLKLEYG